MSWKSLDPRRSLFGLLLCCIAGGLGVGLFAVLALLYGIYASSTERMVRDGLYGQAEEIAEEIRFSADGEASLQMHEPMQWAYDAFFANLKYRVLDPQGRLLLSSEPGQGPLLPPGAASALAAPDYFTLSGGDGLLHVASFPFEQEGRRFIVQTARSDRFGELAAEAMMPAVFETASVLAASAFVIFVLSLLLSIRIATSRVRQVSAAAEGIRADNLDARLQTRGVPAEIAPLVDAFNRALDRLAEGFRMQQRFVANAAHELKTPLAIMRAQTELYAEGELRGRLLADIDFMTRNVQQMLQLSQVQDIRNYRFGEVDLRQIAEEVAAVLENDPRLQGKVLAIEGAAMAPALADRSALFAALRNLVENALKWTPVEGRVLIFVEPHGFRVRDQGPGFDEAHRHLLFERFWRADASDNHGSGLGLSIVAEVAHAHGGEAVARNLAQGLGSEFELRLGRDGPAPGPITDSERP